MKTNYNDPTSSRRSFLRSVATSSLAVGAVPLLNSSTAEAAEAPVAVKSRIKLGISTYSYWHFRDPKTPIETVIDRAAALGVEGVDILHRQMDSEEIPYLQKLKRHAFVNGVDLICLSIHQDFVSPNAEDREKAIQHTIRCIRLAHEMGIPGIRLNSGRWGTVGSFNRLMELRGEEPPLEGYTLDNAFEWCIDSINKCLEAAARYGVVLALENHWGLTRTPEGLLRIAKAIDSPWLGVLMDTGNFLEDPYDKLEMIADRAVFVQAKTYYGGGEWYTLDLDYPRIGQILKSVNYSGYVSIEFEGKAPYEEGVSKSVEMLRAALG